MPAWIVSLVVTFVLRQISKFSESTDWTKVKADALARVAKVLPTWLLPSVSDVVGQVVDVFAAALKDTEDLKDISTKLLAGDFTGALTALVAMVEKLAHLPQAQEVAGALQYFQLVHKA